MNSQRLFCSQKLVLNVRFIDFIDKVLLGNRVVIQIKPKIIPLILINQIFSLMFAVLCVTVCARSPKWVKTSWTYSRW